MTVDQFHNGYWYAVELKVFGRELGIPGASKMRKDQLESAILQYLRNGSLTEGPSNARRPSGPKDCEIGLSPDLPVRHYTSNKETKQFLLFLCREIEPNFKPQSGTRYLLNRWRDEQLERGRSITYRDLARAFLKINAEKDGPLRTEHARYNNFYADYRAFQKDVSHQEIVRAWKETKSLDIPKTFAAWQKLKSSKK